MNKQIIALPLDLVIVGKRLRLVDDDYVDLLATSLKERGQETPIVVGVADKDGRHPLIAGAHRMDAAHRAGLKTIDARIVEATADEATLIEIDENLMRRELSQMDRAVFLAARQDVWERLYPQTAHGKAKKGKDLEKTTSLSSFAESFTAATAKKLGLDQRTIQRVVARAAIDPEVRAMIASHPIADSGAELDKLAALSRGDQMDVAEALTRGDKPARSVSAALVEIKGAPSTSRAAETARQFQALMGGWKKAGKAARRQFLEFLVKEGEVTLAKDGAQ
jgi:ParB family transcriptional regulator, chromosome partitioning protein